MSASDTTDWLDQIKWDADGLIPAIAQDRNSGRCGKIDYTADPVY